MCTYSSAPSPSPLADTSASSGEAIWKNICCAKIKEKQQLKLGEGVAEVLEEREM